MTDLKPVRRQKRPSLAEALPTSTVMPAFAEAPAWKSVGPGWRPLFGNYRSLGFSFEWHEFTTRDAFDWGRSFHPGSIELCLNLAGRGQLKDQNRAVELLPQTFTFYFQGDPPLSATRVGGEPHRFVTVEFSPEFLRTHFPARFEDVHPLVAAALDGRAVGSGVTPPERLAVNLQQLMESLRHCPVFRPAQELWFRSKALEIAAQLFFRPAQGELLCTRTQRLVGERVDRAKLILRERMQEPPALEELAKMVGCSPFYPSQLMMFISARSAVSGSSAQGYFQVTPPAMRTRLWATDYSVNLPPTQWGFVAPRLNLGSVAAMLDGHAERFNLREMQDMRHWCNLADRPDWTLPQ